MLDDDNIYVIKCEEKMWEGVILASVVKCDESCGQYVTCVIIIYVWCCEHV